MNQPSRNVINIMLNQPSEIHTFSLKPMSYHCQFKDHVTISFEEIPNQKGLKVGVRPQFNFDRCYFTPAFILPFEKEIYNTYVQQNTNGVSQHKENFNKETNMLFIAKPLNKRCHVCKQYIENLIKHIEHKVHKKNLNNSHINLAIGDLIHNFQNSKTRKIEKRIFRYVNDVNQSSLDQPKKRRIIENSLTHAPQGVKLAKDASQSTNCQLNNSEFKQKMNF